MKINHLHLDAELNKPKYMILWIHRGEKAHHYYTDKIVSRPARLLNLFLAFLHRMEQPK